MRLSLREAKKLGLVVARSPGDPARESAGKKPYNSQRDKAPSSNPKRGKKSNLSTIKSRLKAAGQSFPEPSGSIRISIPGRAVPKERPRMSFANGVVYTPSRTKKYAKKVREVGIRAMQGLRPFSGPVEIEMVSIMEVPAGWDVQRRLDALGGNILPTNRPDVDNLLKNVLDSLCEVVYGDDAQIVKKTASKRYGPVAETVLLCRRAPIPYRDEANPDG